MEYVVTIIILLIVLVILKFIFDINIKKVKQIGENKKLDEIVSKYPDNIEICRDYLKMLSNEKVKVEEDENSKTSLYIAILDKIIIANIKESYTRIQTIAHECLHSIQDRKILIFNFIFSNIYLLYFVLISILAIFNVLPQKAIFLIVLIILGFIYYIVRTYLENDAMIKARYLAKEYMQEKGLSSKEEIEEIVNEYDNLNSLGIKCVNYNLFFNICLKTIIFCIIAVF